ncbi:MAG: hypothetical protein HGA84_02905 [Syntrophobacteraceae bacterium]|nr:hypothetical protein [Syntrophobacteraceae bacterium]
MKYTVQVEVGGRPLVFECGHLATQASGAVRMQYGDTVVMVAATKEDRVREGIDFVPLMVDYQEMSYAVGRIPGGFFRRESQQRETIVCAPCLDESFYYGAISHFFFGTMIEKWTDRSCRGQPDILSHYRHSFRS